MNQIYRRQFASWLKPGAAEIVDDRGANPVLVMIAAILMAAVTIVYVADRSVDPDRYPSHGLSPGAMLLPPS